MREKIVQTLGNPGTFDITDKDNPLYYIARYSHECSLNLYHLNAQGFQFEQPTSTEAYTTRAQYDSWLTAVTSWLSTAVTASEDGDPIPAVPNFAGLPVPVGPEGYLVLLLQMALELFLTWIRQKLDSDTDTSEIAQVLERCFLGKDALGDEYQIIQQLANTPLEILIGDGANFEDIVYGDRPIA